MFVSADTDAYVRGWYRRLHQIPEIGFELPNTVAAVKQALEEMGIAYTEKYGTSSIVAELAAEKAGGVIALRADMDGLPLEEKAAVEFPSRHSGAMHACGHDAHTAMLLGAARILKGMEASLSHPVRLLFQPSEEGAVSGAAMMVENGCMDNVEKVLCLHVEPSLPTGTVGLYEGAYMAACHPYSITFHGRSAHATAPEKAIDALSMAVEAYTRIREMKAGEWAQLPKHILSLSSLQAGQVHNVIPGEATLLLSFRFYDILTHDTIDAQIKDICRQCAEKAGGTVTFDDRISCPAVFNDPAVVAAARNAAIAAVGEGNVLPVPQRYSSEDFSHYLTKAPGVLVRIGIRNEEIGCGAVCHDAAFKVDEAALKVGCEVLASFALEG